MLVRSDLRFQATGMEALKAETIVRPIRLQLDRPTAEAAPSDVRKLTECLKSMASACSIVGGRLELLQPAQRSELSIEQKSRSEVILALTVCLQLTPPAGEDYWSRVAAVAAVAVAADFAQRFSQHNHGKGIEDIVGRAERVVGLAAADKSREAS